MPTGSDSTTVLVVDDEENVADVYALRLDGVYETRVAYSGTEALETLDEDIDIVLLDRRMPDISGDEILEEIRERGYNCRVIMLTAVDPGLDIVDMPFDDYLCKPVEKEDLVDAIEQQRRLQRYDEQLSAYLETFSKLTLLESELPSRELEDDNDDIQRLRDRAEQIRADLESELEELDDIERAFENVGRYPG